MLAELVLVLVALGLGTRGDAVPDNGEVRPGDKAPDFKERMVAALGVGDQDRAGRLVEEAVWQADEVSFEDRLELAALLRDRGSIEDFCWWIRRLPFNGSADMVRGMARQLADSQDPEAGVQLYKLKEAFPRNAGASYAEWLRLQPAVPIDLVEEQLRTANFFSHESVDQVLSNFPINTTLTPYELVRAGFWRTGIAKQLQGTRSVAAHQLFLATLVDYPLAFSQFHLLLSGEHAADVHMPPAGTASGRAFQNVVFKTKDLARPIGACQTLHGQTIWLDERLTATGEPLDAQASVEVALALIIWYTRRPADALRHVASGGTDVASGGTDVASDGTDVATIFNRTIRRNCDSRPGLYTGVQFGTGGQRAPQ